MSSILKKRSEEQSETPEQSTVTCPSEEASSSNSSSRRTYNSTTSTVNTVNNNEIRHYQQCHNHNRGHHQCYCIREFYEDDEVCRRDQHGRLEFGIVSRYENEGTDRLKVFWTLISGIEEQELDLKNPFVHDDLRLVDRKVAPGDTVYINQKRGEVIDVSWSCYARIMDNGMSLVDIPCERLDPLIPYYTGQRLEFDGWIGTVQIVWTKATIMFPRANCTGKVDCSKLPEDRRPYPGRRVRYTYDEYIKADYEMRDGGSLANVFKDVKEPPEATVLYLHVSSVQVKWNGKIAPTRDPSTMPATTLSRSQLKKRVRILGTPVDKNWDADPNSIGSFHQYYVQAEDLIIPQCQGDLIEQYMDRKYFNYEAELESPSKTLVCKLEKEQKIPTNMAYVVKVLRYSRILHVKWSASGKIEKLRANKITKKVSIKRPFHQFVQKKVTLVPYTYDEYGAIMSYDTNDTMAILWLTKKKGYSSTQVQPTRDSTDFIMKYQVKESVYDIEPHFAYGSISPKHIVFRSLSCRLPEAIFTFGWVRKVNQHGQVIIVSMRTKQEYSVYPSEIETTGMRIYSEEGVPVVSALRSGGPTMASLHGLPALKVADNLFVKNLQMQLNWAGVVVPDTEHFGLLPNAPPLHAFYRNKFEVETRTWIRAVKNDQIFLMTRANEELGTIWIKGFRDRLDLFSILMAAPSGTPYEGGLYTLDVQLVPDYPASPPAIYLTTVLSTGGCSGNDCRPALRQGIYNLELGYDVIPPYTLLESLVAVQSKLFSNSGCLDTLTPPSSAGSFQRKESFMKQSEERLTNAQILVDVLDLMFRMVMDPPKLWTQEIINYFHMTFHRTKKRHLTLLNLQDTSDTESQEECSLPTFSVRPLTDGFTTAIIGRIDRFEELIGKLSH